LQGRDKVSKHYPRKSALSRKLISVAVASCFAAQLAFANPTAPTVVHGSAAFQQSGNLLQITNSPNAIINWGSFSIAAHEVTRFVQQSQASSVLNRVVGQDPSSILGALQSNGRVFLINPNGILFGAGAQIDVAGLVASTLSLSNADFLAGRLNFTEVSGAGSIVNQGNITTQSGGQVYLVAPDITNSGIITSPQGEVVLAAGKSVELVNPGTPELRVEVTAAENEARNLGEIVADSGRVGIYAGLINHSGTIRADSAQVTEDGRIVLRAMKNVTLESGSLTTANGPNGGKIEIQSGDTTLVSGTVEARSIPSSLTGEGGDGSDTGTGGTIHILGDKVGLIESARIDASGESGGGTVLVGGDFQGNNPDIQNAYRTYVGPDTTVAADAITSGDGGKVIVWADDGTRAYGTISARGGSVGGNGGFVEVSGKRWLDFNASVDTRAPNGATGILLLDPTNIFIADDQASATLAGMLGTDISIGDSGPSLFEAIGIVQDSLLTTGVLQSNLETNDVAVSTANVDGLGVGNITVVDPVSWGSNHSLSLLTHNNVNVNAAITNSGAGNVKLFAGWDGSSTITPVVTSGTGTINLNSPVSVSSVSGEVHLVAGSGITQSATAPVTAANLLADGGEGFVSMNAATNMVGTLAGRISVPSNFGTSRSFRLKNGQTLDIGTVGGSDGVKVELTQALNQTYGIEIDITTTSGDLNVNQPVSGGFSNIIPCVLGSDCAALTATIDLAAAQDINVTRSIRGSAITLTAGQDIHINSPADEIRAFGEASGLPSDASIVLDAGRHLTIQNSTIAASSLIGGAAAVALSAGTGAVNISNGSGISTVLAGGSASGGSSSVTIDAGSGISVSDSTIQAGASFSRAGAATVNLDGNGGQVTLINSAISAFAGEGATGFDAEVNVTGAGVELDESTIVAQGGLGGDGPAGTASITLNAVSGSLHINNNSHLFAAGGFGDGSDGGSATIALTANSISVSDGTITSIGGSASFSTGGIGLVTLDGSADISVNNSQISSTGGSGFGSGAGGGAAAVELVAGNAMALTGSTNITATGGSPGAGGAEGDASVTITSSAGNIDTASDITAIGNVASIALSASSGFIHSTGGALDAQCFSDSCASITLDAANGIGEVGNPIRIAEGELDLSVTNSTSGAVVLAQPTGDISINVDINIQNDAPGGLIDITAETGSIFVDAAFSHPNNLLALRAAGSSNFIEIGASGSLSGAGVTLHADNMSIGGSVTATGTVQLAPFSTNRNVNIEAADGGGALSLTPAEIQQITAALLEIGRSTDTGTLTVATALTSGDINAGTLLLAHQNIAINQAMTLTADNENLTLTAGSGTISQGGGGTIATGGLATLNAGGNITLAGANDFNQVNVGTAANVTLNDINSIVLNGVGVSGSLNIFAGGAITQTAGITVGGTASFDGGANPITLTHAGNDFTGAVGLSGTSVSITDANALTLGAVSASNLTVSAVGITQNAAGISVGGTASFNAGAGPITLTTATNDFGTVLLNNTGANDVAVTDANAIILGASSVGSGALTVNAVGIAQSGAIIQTAGAGAAAFNAGAGGIALTNAGNSFTGAVSLNNSGANDAVIINSGTLNFGALNVGRDLIASADGAASDLILSAPGIVGGAATLEAGNDISLNAALAVGGDLALTAGAHIGVTDAVVSAGGALTANAAFLDITAITSVTQLRAGTNLTVAVDEVMLTGGGVNGAVAELLGGPGTFNLVTNGDIVLTGGSGLGAFTRIFGNPDVNLTVGGAIHMNAGSGLGAFAAIESASPTSINIDFPNLASGGFFVNGVHTVFDTATASGFVAGGAPAVLGQNLNVTYALAPLPPAPIEPVISETDLIPLLTPQLSATDQIMQVVEDTGVETGLDAIVAGDPFGDEERQARPPLCR
jgi:filamentous hemagglutinin family protein